ncbi:MAG: DNA double-strand break repair nuclease NurA [Candidatus Nitrosocaldus sp.]|nr:DNA double-strand break repair nuclease NurA [Candidatus Nitrosocaldus sp.]MDW8276079.1 DNA double-strand break repair nuclease NurA [Candidatus Nitrosocaldus sp.]
MLFEVYEHALEHRDSIISKVKNAKELLDYARSRWVEYEPVPRVEPSPRASLLAGVDSSFNYIVYKGFYLYAIAGVSVGSDASFITQPRMEVDVANLHEDDKDLSPRNELLARCIEVEHGLAGESMDKVAHVLIDGSLLARFYDRRHRRVVTVYEYARELMRSSKVLFVAKSSASNTLLKGNLADIYYFSRATLDAGYAMSIQKAGDKAGDAYITVVYSRLKPCTPVIKIEVPGERSEQEVRGMLDMLCSESISGYPYVLRLAHERCKIHNDDMLRMADILGLGMEEGGREVLDE